MFFLIHYHQGYSISKQHTVQGLLLLLPLPFSVLIINFVYYLQEQNAANKDDIAKGAGDELLEKLRKRVKKA